MTCSILLTWLKPIALDSDLARAESALRRFQQATVYLMRGGHRRTLRVAAITAPYLIQPKLCRSAIESRPAE